MCYAGNRGWGLMAECRFGMLVWTVLSDGECPFGYIDCIEGSDESAIATLKSDDSFVSVACETLARLGLDNSESSAMAQVFENTLQPHPERRTLEVALSYLHYKGEHTLDNLTGLSTIAIHDQGRPFEGPSLERYEDAVNNYRHVSKHVLRCDKNFKKANISKT